MSLREKFLDMVIDGEIGHGLIVSSKEFQEKLNTENKYDDSFLPNSEIQATHSPNYAKIVRRVRPGVYQVLPSALEARMKERESHPAH